MPSAALRSASRCCRASAAGNPSSLAARALSSQMSLSLFVSNAMIIQYPRLWLDSTHPEGVALNARSDTPVPLWEGSRLRPLTASPKAPPVATHISGSVPQPPKDLQRFYYGA